MSELKRSRAEAQFAKATKRTKQEKTKDAALEQRAAQRERLRALRLAKEAADKESDSK